jgi:putative ABC transport system permease protein
LGGPAAVTRLGCLLGWWLAGLMAAMFRTELYRIPLVVEPSTFGAAVLVAMASTAASAVVVGRSRSWISSKC